MNKNKYIESMNKLQVSPDFKERTAKLMKDSLNEDISVSFEFKEKTANLMRNSLNEKGRAIMKRRLVFNVAAAALIVTVSVAGVSYMNLQGSNEDNKTMMTTEMAVLDETTGITIPKVEIPETTEGVTARMMGLFVYKGKVYTQGNSTVVTNADSVIDKNDMLNLRGDYLGKTIGGINEWSKQTDYATEFASTIGEAEVYTVKGYDSDYRLMVYTEWDGGFSCEIYDSFGGLTLQTGADLFDKLNLKDNISSYTWTSYDSWNNGNSELVNGEVNDTFTAFINALYTSTPIGENTDMFTENTASDSQKFIYLHTNDNLITSLRLFKDGFVYVQGAGFFQVDKAIFDAFYNSMPIENATSTNESTDVVISIPKTSYPVDTKNITLTIKNTSDNEYFYGVDYSIEKLNGTTWKTVPAVKDMMFIEIAYTLAAQSEQEFVIDLSQLNPRLDEGNYRVVKGINNNVYYIEFNLTK